MVAGQDLTVPAHNISWVASALVLGQITGSFFGSIVPDKIGRKTACQLCACASLLSWSLVAASQYDWMIFLGRFLTGLFDSLPVAGAVMYVSEVTEITYRGSFLNSTTIASGLGIALGLLCGSNIHWRFACIIPIVKTLFILCILSYCYESPVYLLMKAKDPEKVLVWYRESFEASYQTKENISKELAEMRASTDAGNDDLRSSIKKLFSGINCKAFIILFVIFTLYPITGAYSIVFFAIDLFNQLGLGSAVVVAVISALLRCVGTALSSALLFRFGRRNIMVITTATCAILNGVVGGLIILRDHVNSDIIISWTLTVLIMVFMFCVGISIVGFPWILMGKLCNSVLICPNSVLAEWFSPDLKLLVSMTMICYQFFMTFVAVQITAPIINLAGHSGLFIFFCIICSIKTGFILAFVPETHGKTYEQVKNEEIARQPVSVI